MNSGITFIFRKRLPHYYSIEELFFSIEKEISKIQPTKKIELGQSGGTPLVILKNLIGFKKTQNELYHITGDVHYMALRTGRNTILTIHDVQSIVKGPFFKKIYLKFFWFWMPALFVKRITVISEFTKAELLKTVPFAKHKVKVVYNPVDSSFRFNAYSFNNVTPKILLMGTKPNKNLERVLMALVGIECEVMLIGHLTNNQKKLLATLDLNCIVKSDLTLYEVIAEYNDCDLLCFASTYEGFGMPIIEAQAVGRPVLTSNLGAMKEVALDSALLVDPYDIDAIKSGIKKIIEDSHLRNHLIQKGLRNAKRFSSKAIIQNYVGIYNELIASMR